MLTENEITRIYLQDLNSQEPLSKEEERLIGLEIEKNKKILLEECSKSDLFWQQIDRLEESIKRNKNNLIKLTSRLDNESSNKQEKSVEADFNKLFQDKTLENLLLVDLTTSAVQNLLNPIKTLNKNVQEVEDEQT